MFMRNSKFDFRSPSLATGSVWRKFILDKPTLLDCATTNVYFVNGKTFTFN